jgi:hypothetical protein
MPKVTVGAMPQRLFRDRCGRERRRVAHGVQAEAGGFVDLAVDVQRAAQ